MFIGVWLFCGFIGGMIGAGKKIGSGQGFALGLILGILGVIIVASSPAVAEPSVLQRVEARPSEQGWHQDPLGRFDGRWFDGTAWTQHVGRVAADGTRQQFEDPI
jgi:hypothetical protein